eukprot:TRINITY_DN3151_c0_g1_i1.p1 TRINITY_DN3151_c0_g1~~TRINITY_DN3151_c0_g1_i1.p1  ORF type:complete len:150 (-),score=27.46 TRINITY_DN3151_c0_g1_i1:62-511(-)
MLRMRKYKTHVKNFRPNYLCLTGKPADRPNLVYFANILRQSAHSLLVFGHVTAGSYKQNIQRYRDMHLDGYLQSGTEHFPNKEPKVKAFFDAVIAPDMREGAQMLIQLSGLGNVKPNVVLMGMKTDWLKKPTSPTAADEDSKVSPEKPA